MLAVIELEKRTSSGGLFTTRRMTVLTEWFREMPRGDAQRHAQTDSELGVLKSVDDWHRGGLYRWSQPSGDTDDQGNCRPGYQ